MRCDLLGTIRRCRAQLTRLPSQACEQVARQQVRRELILTRDELAIFDHVGFEWCERHVGAGLAHLLDCAQPVAPKTRASAEADASKRT